MKKFIILLSCLFLTSCSNNDNIVCCSEQIKIGIRVFAEDSFHFNDNIFGEYDINKDTLIVYPDYIENVTIEVTNSNEGLTWIIVNAYPNGTSGYFTEYYFNNQISGTLHVVGYK